MMTGRSLCPQQGPQSDVNTSRYRILLRFVTISEMRWWAATLFVMHSEYLLIGRRWRRVSSFLRLSLKPARAGSAATVGPNREMPLLCFSRMRQTCESVACDVQQEVLADCARLSSPSSNPEAALSVGDSHGLWVRLSRRRGETRDRRGRWEDTQAPARQMVL